MKKTITIRKDIPKSIIIGLAIGFIIVFVIEHFGEFSYIAKSESTYSGGKINLVEYVSPKTPLQNIYLDTPLGNTLTFGGNDFTVGDMHYSRGEFQSYTTKIKYYFKATFVDFKFILLIGLLITLIIYLSKNFRVKLN
jgi:hypothetical protein